MQIDGIQILFLSLLYNYAVVATTTSIISRVSLFVQDSLGAWNNCFATNRTMKGPSASYLDNCSRLVMLPIRSGVD